MISDRAVSASSTITVTLICCPIVAYLGLTEKEEILGGKFPEEVVVADEVVDDGVVDEEVVVVVDEVV
ncbi:MAG: hypothetical protein DRN78_02905, partial [Thermoproteota archaeon]